MLFSPTGLSSFQTNFTWLFFYSQNSHEIIVALCKRFYTVRMSKNIPKYSSQSPSCRSSQFESWSDRYWRGLLSELCFIKIVLLLHFNTRVKCIAEDRISLRGSPTYCRFHLRVVRFIFSQKMRLQPSHGCVFVKFVVDKMLLLLTEWFNNLIQVENLVFRKKLLEIKSVYRLHPVLVTLFFYWQDLAVYRNYKFSNSRF